MTLSFSSDLVRHSLFSLRDQASPLSHSGSFKDSMGLAHLADLCCIEFILVTVERHHNQGNSYKRKCLIGDMSHRIVSEG